MTYRHERPLETVRGLGHQRLVFVWLLVTVGLQHEPTSGVVQLLVATLATDYRVIGRAAHLVVRIVAAQRRQGIPDVRFVGLGMRCHPEPSTGPDAVSVSHAAHPLPLKRPLKIKQTNKLLTRGENRQIIRDYNIRLSKVSVGTRG